MRSRNFIFLLSIVILLPISSNEAKVVPLFADGAIVLADSVRGTKKEKTSKERVPKEGEKGRDSGSDDDYFEPSSGNAFSGDIITCLFNEATSLLWDMSSSCCAYHFQQVGMNFIDTVDSSLDSIEIREQLALLGAHNGLLANFHFSRSFFMGDLTEEYGGAWVFGTEFDLFIKSGLGVGIGYEYHFSSGKPKYDYEGEVRLGGIVTKYFTDEPVSLDFSAHVLRVGIVFHYMPKIDSKHDISLHTGIYGAYYMIRDEARIDRLTEYPGGTPAPSRGYVTETLKFSLLAPSIDFGFNYKFGRGSRWNIEWKIRYDFLSREAEEVYSVPHDWNDMKGNFLMEIGFNYIVF